MKETKVYVVKRPQGEYEDYQEPIVKVFLDEKKSKSYVKKENAKLPLKQAKKCNMCCYKWECIGQKGKETPICFKGDKYNYCENYFKYRDIQKLFIEEHEIDDIKTHDRELVKKVCEKIREYLRTQVIYCGGQATELDIMIASAWNQVLEDVKQFLDQIQKEFEK